MSVRPFLAAALVAAFLAPAGAGAIQNRLGRALVDLEEIRKELEAAVDERRRHAGLEPVASEPRVRLVAQEEARAIARRLAAGIPLRMAVDDGLLEERLVGVGYEPHAFEAAIALSDANPEEVVAQLMGKAPGRGELWRADLPDIGIGIAEFEWSLVYLVVLAHSAADKFSAETASLSDLSEVRTLHFDLVNEARHEAGRNRFQANACLDEVAQAYAERMLSEGFLSHVTADGEKVTERVRTGRCPHRPVGENLAMGPNGVDEVVEQWLESPSHREVLMDARFDELGLGLAMGRGPDGYRVIWVQVLGRRDPRGR